MRRILALALTFILLACGVAYAQEELSALDLANGLAEMIEDMEDVKSAPLKEGEKNRAIWTDGRIDKNCALVVYEDEAAAIAAAVEDGTRSTAVRSVGKCNLQLSNDLGQEELEAYVLALAELLGVELTEEAPDFILNVNTKKFHKPECSSVEDMKESNRQEYWGEKELLEEKGYEACKRCKP